jgi:hypothetical protein
MVNEQALMRQQQIAPIILSLWLTLVAVFMVLAGSIDLYFYFFLCLLGFLVIVQFLDLTFIKPGYLKYIRYIIAAGIVIFGLIIVQLLLDIISG